MLDLRSRFFEKRIGLMTTLTLRRVQNRRSLGRAIATWDEIFTIVGLYIFGPP